MAETICEQVPGNGPGVQLFDPLRKQRTQMAEKLRRLSNHRQLFTTGPSIVGLAATLSFGCATGPSPLPRAEQSSLDNAELTPLKKLQADSSGLERFWLRDGVAIGTIKWDVARSRAEASAPKELLQAIRDEVGRLNQAERAGEDIWITVNVYHWSVGLFSSTPRARIELIGRDRAGQVVWMGQGEIAAHSKLAKTLADSRAVIVAQEVVRKLREELAL